MFKKNIKMEQLDLVLLQETKCYVEKIMEVSRKLGMDFKFMEVIGQGSVGYLLTWWNP